MALTTFCPGVTPVPRASTARTVIGAPHLIRAELAPGLSSLLAGGAFPDTGDTP